MQERKSIRLPNYDYSQAGCYFVTICTQNRIHYFGEIVGATLRGRPNNPYAMIESWLMKLSDRYDDVEITEYVIMPNHVHFIINKTGDHAGTTGDHMGLTGDHMGSPLRDNRTTRDHVGTTGDHTGSPLRGNRTTRSHMGATGDHMGTTGDHTGSPLRDIVGWFKTMTTNEYIRGVKQGRFEPFDKRLWQRNYYEHIIRDEQDYYTIAEYIRNNPLKWETDSMNKEAHHA